MDQDSKLSRLLLHIFPLLITAYSSVSAKPKRCFPKRPVGFQSQITIEKCDKNSDDSSGTLSPDVHEERDRFSDPWRWICDPWRWISCANASDIETHLTMYSMKHAYQELFKSIDWNIDYEVSILCCFIAFNDITAYFLRLQPGNCRGSSHSMKPNRHWQRYIICFFTFWLCIGKFIRYSSGTVDAYCTCISSMVGMFWFCHKYAMYFCKILWSHLSFA